MLLAAITRSGITRPKMLKDGASTDLEKDLSLMYHLIMNVVVQIANMLVAAKADDVCILDVSSQCSFTEHMVLATGRSHRHIQAAASAVAYQVSLA